MNSRSARAMTGCCRQAAGNHGWLFQLDLHAWPLRIVLPRGYRLTIFDFLFSFPQSTERTSREGVSDRGPAMIAINHVHGMRHRKRQPIRARELSACHSNPSSACLAVVRHSRCKHLKRKQSRTGVSATITRQSGWSWCPGVSRFLLPFLPDSLFSYSCEVVLLRKPFWLAHRGITSRGLAGGEAQPQCSQWLRLRG